MIRTLDLENSRVTLEQCRAGIVARIERENAARRPVEWAGPLPNCTVRALRRVAHQ